MKEIGLHEQHRSFLNKRGITDKVIDAFSITSRDVPNLSLQNAITIPVHTPDGEFSFNKYRRDPMEGDVKPKYLYERGGKVTLYGADHLVAHSRVVHEDKFENGVTKVVITEGELDTLVCWSLGIPAVSSTGGAMSFQKDWADDLSKLQVYICFDNDEAGHKGAIKILELIPTAKVVFIPSNIPGVKDISDYVAHGGNFHDLMKSAKGYTSLEEVEEESQIIAGQWGDNLFHRLYVEHHKKLPLPTNTRGSLPTRTGDDKLSRAKEYDCLAIAGIKWRRKGAYMETTCFWHNDNDPSLTYYKRTNSCYCHACGKYADAIDLYMQVEGLSGKEGFKTAINKLSKWLWQNKKY